MPDLRAAAKQQGASGAVGAVFENPAPWAAQVMSARAPEADYRLRIKVQNNRLASAIELAGYGSVAAFSRACGVYGSDVGELLNLRAPAVCKDGTWREVAVKIAAFLMYELPDLFPEDMQALELQRNEVYVAMTRDQVAALLPGPEQACAAQQVRERLLAAVELLPPRQAVVITERFGLGGPARTLADVAETLGVSRERVRQLEARALRNLRKKARDGAIVDPEDAP